ncbi:MAG: ABC transporter transmembrane domain-containing protein [Deltaproteobacteria bacterium]|nr:ABC transporter transmembrane domain-containing protein [Deltaproteobacteria bacterium]
MKLYFRLLRYIYPYWHVVLIAILSMLAYAGMNSMLAFLFGPAIKVLFVPDASDIKLLPFDIVTLKPENAISFVIWSILIVAAIKGITSYINNFCLGYVAQRIIHDIRNDLFRHILKLPQSYFTANASGIIASRVTGDVALIQKLATDTVITSLKHFFTLFALIGVVFMLDWKLALISFFAFPLTIFPAIELGKRIRRFTYKGQASIATMLSLLHEAFSGIRIIKAFGSYNYESNRFEITNAHFTKQLLKTVRIRALNTPLMETIAAFAIAITIYYAHNRITDNSLAPEHVISFFGALVMLYQPIKALNGINLNIQQGMAAAERVFEVFDTKTEPDGGEGTKSLSDFRNSIKFENIIFSYNEKPVLNGVNIEVKKGEKVAIVGSSGSGKSTLVSLLPRFYDPQRGAIIIDGVDTREYTLESLRSRMALISQDIILFDDSVERNIAYGDTSKTKAEIEAAAAAANAREFIARLPDGYNTVIGERGIRLSGGEKQRISIARAILKDAPILIMDEATSSLDTESEQLVQRGIDNLMTGRTAVIIAHRLSTVQNADRIVVLKNGTVVESGRHEELLKLNGEYSRLHSVQFKDS